MRRSVAAPSERLTAAQKRQRQFEESVYQALCSYRRGEYEATSGVAVGALDIPLSTLFDVIATAAKGTFK